MKTDMSKAYDRLEWSFIRKVLLRMGFSDIVADWILQCITSVSYTFLINDMAQERVTPTRGIRQGGPLSIHLHLVW